MPGTRALRGSLTRELIIGAALQLVGREGATGLSIRRLAAQLGVSPMAIYRHVRDRDDLIAEVVDRLLAEVWRPTASTRDWRAWLEEAADRLRSFLVDQPIALEAYLRHPVTSAAAVARMEAMLGVLRERMGDKRKAGHTYAAIHTYTLGFAALEASRRSTPGSRDDALTRELSEYTSPQRFRETVRAIIAGYLTAS